MAHLINKDDLVTEIERLKTIYNDDENILYVAKYNILVDILSFLDTLEVKEVEEEPISEEWIEELTTKLNSMSKEDFKKVFDKYAVDFNEEPISEWDKNQAKIEIQAQSMALAHGCPGEETRTNQ